MQNIPLNQNEFREKKHNFFEILYSVIVNNRAILLAEFFDLLGDVVNFFDIYGNQEMVIFHPWAIIIMCLSGFSFGMNTLFKKQLASIKYLNRDEMIPYSDIELGLIEKSKMVDKLLNVSKKRKSVYEEIAESMSIILTLMVEDFMSFVFTIIVLKYNGKVELNAQLYNIMITGSMIMYQLFSLWVKRNSILEERKNNLQENMIIEFSSKLKQRHGDRRDEEYMVFVNKMCKELYLNEDSEKVIKFSEKDNNFKTSILGNNKYLRYSISCFEYFFKLHPIVKITDIYKNSNIIDENESLLTIALDYQHYQIATKMFEKFGNEDIYGNNQCPVTKNWISLQNNKDGTMNEICVFFKLAMLMRPVSLTPVYPWNNNYEWYQNEHWDKDGEPIESELIQLFNDQEKQIDREMKTPLCSYLVKCGLRRRRLKSAREQRKALLAMVYKDWDEVKKLWFDRNLSPVFDCCGPYQKYKKEYNSLFFKDDNEKNTEKLDKNIEMFKKEYPHININDLIISERWGVPKWWFKITILHDNILLDKYDNVINLIEKEGADPWKKTGAGQNCLDIAKNKKYQDLIDYFEKNYPEMTTK